MVLIIHTLKCQPPWGNCKTWTLDSGLDRGLDIFYNACADDVCVLGIFTFFGVAMELQWPSLAP